MARTYEEFDDARKVRQDTLSLVEGVDQRLATIVGMYRFISNHEKRHQGQLHDILGDASFPEPATRVRAA